MIADIFDELGTRSVSVVLGLILGGLIAWLVGQWRRRRQRLNILAGDARDTIVIHHHLVETADGPDPVGGPGTVRVPAVLRIRALGQAELPNVVPNGHLASVLL